MKPPLNALRAFAAVYDCAGVRAAARELGVAHSAISRHLWELETWLGVPLTEPGKARSAIAFTTQGKALGKSMASCFREIERAVSIARESSSARSVTISTTPSFAARWLLPRLQRLEQAHPRLEISVLVDQKLNDLAASGIDIGIRMGTGGWPDVHSEALMDDALYPVVSPAVFASHRRAWLTADLLSAKLLHDRDPHASWADWRNAHGPPNLNVQKGVRLASSDLVLRAAAQGMGVALARHCLVADDIASGVLVRPIPKLQLTLKDAYWIVRPKHGQLRVATHSAVNWLKEAALRSTI
jgi:LysR family transcriptional regulator, glycine cleavage system transcriptional activator